MNLFFHYIGTKWRGIAAYLFSVGLFVAAGLLYREPAEAVAYPAALCLLFGGIFLVVGFLRVKKTHGVLTAIRQMAVFVPESLPVPDGIPEEDYRSLRRCLQEEAARRQDADEEKYRDMVE